MIEPEHPRLSIQRQCALVSISRSAFYYQPAGETPLNLALMRLIDEAFLKDAVTLLDAAFPGASSRLDEACRGDTRDGRFRLYDAACLNP